MERTIACVLRSGGRFNGRWVQRLQKNAKAFAPEHRFVCLSDVAIEGVETIPLAHDWPKWWPIIEVFRPGLFTGRVMYLDLSDLIVDRIDFLFAGTGFVIAPSPANPPPKHGNLASGLMVFDAGDTKIYDRFAGQAQSIINRLHGDQMWIEEMRPHARRFAPHIAVSFRGECQPKGGIPENAKIVFCHGRPKPDEIEERWFRERWDKDW